jgi:hypothetical protein
MNKFLKHVYSDSVMTVCDNGGCQQKVYIHGGMKEEVPLELEVYN